MEAHAGACETGMNAIRSANGGYLEGGFSESFWGLGKSFLDVGLSHDGCGPGFRGECV